MNIQSHTILHYGLDYLPYALRSIYDHMDLLHIVYTPHPSHGHRSDAEPPEARCDLVDTAYAHDPDSKVRWHEVNYWQEHEHRNRALAICQEHGADLVLVVDADEVWPENTLDNVLAYVWDQNRARNWLLNFTTLWRSFDWVVRDDLWPVRVMDLRHADGVAYLPRELGPAYHFGYAVRDRVMRYKMSCHGHKSEWRPDWYETKWLAWPPPHDCHPTNERNFWMPEPFDKSLLPELMREHPFWGMERID